LRGPDELPEELTAEHPVVLQLLAGAVERHDVVGVGSLVGPAVQIQTTQQVDPEIGHAVSVSLILAER
jgi:hypothetical protein